MIFVPSLVPHSTNRYRFLGEFYLLESVSFSSVYRVLISTFNIHTLPFQICSLNRSLLICSDSVTFCNYPQRFLFVCWSFHDTPSITLTLTPTPALSILVYFLSSVSLIVFVEVQFSTVWSGTFSTVVSKKIICWWFGNFDFYTLLFFLSTPRLTNSDLLDFFTWLNPSTKILEDVTTVSSS